jgi:hypothetical protein
LATEEEVVVEQFLGESPSSAQLRQWRESLLARAKRLRRDLKAAAPDQAPALRARLVEMNRQIAALEHEEMISEFVEGEVRYTLAMGSIAEGQNLEE